MPHRSLPPVTRRHFAAAALTAASAQRIVGANGRIRLGFIGVGNRGHNLLQAAQEFADQQIAAVCDIRDDYLDHAALAAGTNPAKFKDYRKLLGRGDIDAVVIATPDHWHAIQTIDACRAGKDVYVEKPLSKTIYEGRRMVEVAAETGRVVQAGIHRRSAPFCREAAAIARSGEIGPVTAARCSNLLNFWPHGIGNPPNHEPPPGVDWDLFLGPAPETTYNPNRERFRYRWFRDYAGGQITDNGVHYLDMIQWGLGQPAAGSVTAMGGKYAIHDNRDTPDTMIALWEFPGPTLVSFTQYSCNAAPDSAGRRSLAEFRGTKGTLYVYFDGYEVIPEEIAAGPFPVSNPLERDNRRRWRESFQPVIEAREGKGSADPRLHVRNFLDCIKTRAKPNCNVETAHRSTTTALIANIALETGQRLEWSAQAERFTNYEPANERLHYEYRKPWKLG